jgi:hypothetical protein
VLILQASYYQMLRKIFSIVFAGLILYNLCGYYFVFQYDQAQVKQVMNERIRDGVENEKQYVEITILNPGVDADFKMLDKGEFLYHGKLYDVVSEKVSGKSIIFRCINDTKEEQLFANYDRYLDWVSGVNAPEKSKHSQAMLYHLIKQALVKNYSPVKTNSYSTIIYYNPTFELISYYITPISPPPRAV